MIAKFLWLTKLNSDLFYKIMSEINFFRLKHIFPIRKKIFCVNWIKEFSGIILPIKNETLQFLLIIFKNFMKEFYYILTFQMYFALIKIVFNIHIIIQKCKIFYTFVTCHCSCSSIYRFQIFGKYLWNQIAVVFLNKIYTVWYQ